MELIDALRQLRAGLIPNTSFGICSNLEILCPDRLVYNFVLDNAPDWPEFSGDLLYPVPSPDPNQTAEAAFWNSPHWEGPYGEARMRLVDHLIESIKS